jgi:hypothetical protein
VSGPRYHLLSLLAAGLAMALGLGLGAGPVAEQSADDSARSASRLQDRVGRLQDRVAALSAEQGRDAERLTALARPLTDGRLDGRSVLLVATPDARATDVRRARAALETAGATVTGTVRLTGTYVDPARAQSPLEDLALRLVPPGVEFADGSSAIERVGTVLARATVQRPEGDAAPSSQVDQDAAEVIAGLEELSALRLDGEPGLRAELAVMVAGPAEEADAQPALMGLLTALDAGSRGAVLAGPDDGAAGPLRWVRDPEGDTPEGVSTVDGVGTPAGAAALVLALAEQAAGKAGQYGLGHGARAVIPVAAADG